MLAFLFPVFIEFPIVSTNVRNFLPFSALSVCACVRAYPVQSLYMAFAIGIIDGHGLSNTARYECLPKEMLN